MTGVVSNKSKVMAKERMEELLINALDLARKNKVRIIKKGIPNEINCLFGCNVLAIILLFDLIFPCQR